MGSLRPLKKDWLLTQEALNKLLIFLGSNGGDGPGGGGEQYEIIRKKLITFFNSRGCSYPEDYADMAFNRVARQIIEGVEIRVAPLYFVLAVARNLLYEYWDRPDKAQYELDALPLAQETTNDPEQLSLKEEERLRQDKELECLESCVSALPPEKRELIIQYYQGETSEKIMNRKLLAARLNISSTALRTKTLRIREKLESCLDDCVRLLPGA